MSPVARRPGGAHTGRAVAVAVVGVTVALALAFAVATLASRGDVDVRLGDDRFEVGDAERLLGQIEQDDAPLLFQDPASFSRPVLLDNPGSDPETGWMAFLALEPTDPTCAVNWDRDEREYVSTCDASTTFPRDGAGLRSFDVEVVEGRVIVDVADRGDD